MIYKSLISSWALNHMLVYVHPSMLDSILKMVDAFCREMYFRLQKRSSSTLVFKSSSGLYQVSSFTNTTETGGFFFFFFLKSPSDRQTWLLYFFLKNKKKKRKKSSNTNRFSICNRWLNSWIFLKMGLIWDSIYRLIDRILNQFVCTNLNLDLVSWEF